MKRLPRVSFTILCALLGCGDGCGSKQAATAPVAERPLEAAAPDSASAAPDAAAPVSDVLPKPTGARLYVSNEDSGDVSVIDLATHTEVARVPVGKRPRAIRLSADGTRLFVALSGSPKQGPDSPERELPPADHAADGVAVIDLVEGRLLRKLESGEDPEQFELSVDGAHVYVTNEEDAQVSIVSVETGKIEGTVKVSGEPEGIAVDPGGTLAYVTSEVENSVDVIDLQKQKRIAQAKTGLRPRSILVTPDGTRVFISNELGGSVTVIDGAKHAVLATVKLDTPGARPMGMALSRDGQQLFVTTGRGKTVAEIDVATAKVERTFNAGGTRPWGIAVSPDGKTLYTANGPSNDVSAIDIASGKLTRRIPVGASPWGVALAEGPQSTSDAAVERP